MSRLELSQYTYPFSDLSSKTEDLSKSEHNKEKLSQKPFYVQ